MKKILIFLFLLFAFFGLGVKNINAYGECTQYGFMATYDFLSDSCKCMSGYAFGKDFMGNTSCVSVDQMCKDQYGYNSSSDYLTNKCKCGYGYAFGKDMFGKIKCISQDSMCKDQLGYGARYNSLYESCECGYGDIIKNGKCTDADLFCSSVYGLYSSYNSSLKQCECDSGYTLDDDSQCVKKQNNVYFTVKELDTDNKKAIIKSDYDYSYYSIEYNSGCYASSFSRYLNHRIVVNLGTDYYLDTRDKIILQDDNETCEIIHREKVDSSFLLEVEDDFGGPTLEQLIAINESNKKTIPTTSAPTPVKITNTPKKIINEKSKKVTKIPETVKVEPKEETTPKVNPEPVKKLKWYQKIFNWFR